MTQSYQFQDPITNQMRENNMLEYVKMILQKVSFDLVLFEKELKKSINGYLLPREVESLKEWCYRMYYHSERHAEIIDGCFEHRY